LVQALALCGRRDEAVERFEQLLTITNDVGLLAEEYDVSAGRQLGNYPQAFSHLGLVVAATTLAGDDPGPAQCRSKAAEHPLQADP
jgi:GH15 family glucan-1,4-alpha-glucosidase